MVEMLDAVTWANLLPTTGPVACYRDGIDSQWRPEGVAALADRIVANITVLANPLWEVFDSETGNAGVDRVAAAVDTRLSLKRWSAVYVNETLHNAQTAALLARGVHWTEAQFWPEPGCYLWAADWNVTPGLVPLWCPVHPIAVQDRHPGPYDVSTCYAPFPYAVAPKPPPPPPKPPPPPQEVPITVQLLQVKQGIKSEEVRALQILLNGRGGYQLAVDAIFGPNTDHAVRDYQARHGLGSDGIAGVHTWGSLLGVPQ
jgi:hypothetical protein